MQDLRLADVHLRCRRGTRNAGTLQREMPHFACYDPLK
jgi:hypothetical protein